MAMFIEQVARVCDADECRDRIEQISKHDCDDGRQQTQLQSSGNIKLEKDALEIRQRKELRRFCCQPERPSDYRDGYD